MSVEGGVDTRASTPTLLLHPAISAPAQKQGMVLTPLPLDPRLLLPLPLHPGPALEPATRKKDLHVWEMKTAAAAAAAVVGACAALLLLSACLGSRPAGAHGA